MTQEDYLVVIATGLIAVGSSHWLPQVIWLISAIAGWRYKEKKARHVRGLTREHDT